MSDQQLCFERDIKPLFRKTDREAMSFAFDLWRCADVRTHADGILAHLRDGTMPCDGVWPPERIELFARWTATGKACECGDAAVSQGGEAEHSSEAKTYEPYWKSTEFSGIKDMFTTSDIECMKSRITNRRILLDDYENVANHANLIYGKLKNHEMPPGNPWPKDKLRVFLEWKENGCPKTRPSV